jgi:ribosome-binding protein aMBF1 (putative translation factor)
MHCKYCQSVIDPERLEFLIEYKRMMVCKNCSVEQKAVGYMDWNHKTAPSLIMVPSNATETIRKLDRANRRAR